jgi:CheY-like chemotaxis protein
MPNTERRSNGESQTHRCGLLVVDDDAEVRELLRVALEGDGFVVATVRNGREALDYLRSHAETCVVLLDLLLPEMDGTAFRAAQLRDRSLAWIPIIVMSGAVDASTLARQVGARRFVRKPLDLDEVRHAVRSIGCRQARSRPANAQVI